MIFHMRIHTQCTAHLMLNKLPSKDFETYYNSCKVLFDSLIQVTAYSIIAIGLKNSGRLALRKLCLAYSIAETFPNIHHVILTV